MNSAALTVRETVDDFSRRLARICAAASSLNSLSADIRHGVPPADLMPFLEQLDRELMLASNQLTIVRDRAKQELDSPARGAIRLRSPEAPRRPSAA